MRDINIKPQDGLWVASIKVGEKWLSRSKGWKTKEEAKKGAKALRDELQAEYLKANPPVANNAGTVQSKKQVNPKKTFRYLIIEVNEAYIAQRRLRSPDTERRAIIFGLEGLGSHADTELPDMKRPWFSKLREFLIDHPDLADSTRAMYAKNLRKAMAYLVPLGLDSSFIQELQNLPITGSKETAGHPFGSNHIKTMMDLEPMESKTSRLLFWIGASGGPQIVDCAFMPLTGVNFETGRCIWNRVKSRETIEFVALPPLLELLKERRAELGETAVYVFPELIFKSAERRKPGCNETAWERIPKRIADRGADNAARIVTEFLKKCGIKAEGYTNKSWRKHNISFWSSLGVKPIVRMRMAGHRKLEQHNRYDTPAYFELKRTSDIMWKYYCAIRDGQEFFIPTTPYDIYEAMMKRWDSFPTILRHHISEEFNGSITKFMDLRHAALEAKLDQVLANLDQTHQENSELRKLVELLKELIVTGHASLAGKLDELLNVPSYRNISELKILLRQRFQALLGRKSRATRKR